MLCVHTCCAVDALKGVAAGVRRFAVSLGVVPTLLLIPTPEPLRAYERDLPPFFYRCNNGQTLVSRLEYEDQHGDGEVLSVYPYPVEERSQVLWRTEINHFRQRGERFSISSNSQDYECKPWRRGDDGAGHVWAIPDPAALKEYAKRFSGKTRYRCAGGHSLRIRVTDFSDAGYFHALMEMDDREQIGLYYSRGNQGHFNSKETSAGGLAFYWFVGVDEDKRSVMRRNLVIDNEVFPCEVVEE